MGIALDLIAVHVRARVALVRVADDVFSAGGLAQKLPLDAGRVTGAAATAQLGCLDLLDHAGGFWSIRTLYRAWYPPMATYSSMSSGLISPQLRRTILTCPLKNGISSQFGTSG